MDAREADCSFTVTLATFSLFLFQFFSAETMLISAAQRLWGRVMTQAEAFLNPAPRYLLPSGVVGNIRDALRWINILNSLFVFILRKHGHKPKHI